MKPVCYALLLLAAVPTPSLAQDTKEIAHPAPNPDLVTDQELAQRAYHAQIIRLIAERRLMRYPYEDKNSGREGRAIVNVAFASDGRIREIKVSRSTGSESLDEQARLAAYRATILAKPPNALIGTAFELNLGLGFALDSPAESPGAQ